jgi:nicotinate-nucleotide adenylyltransferase
MTRATAASLMLPDVTVSVGTDHESPTYTVRTPRRLGERCGKEASISLLIGAARPVWLDTGRDRHQLSDYAHIAATKRPGLDFTAVMPAVIEAIPQRSAATTMTDGLSTALAALLRRQRA